MVDWEKSRLQSLTLKLMYGICIDPFEGPGETIEDVMSRSRVMTMRAVAPSLYREWYGLDRLRLTYQPSTVGEGASGDDF